MSGPASSFEIMHGCQRQSGLCKRAARVSTAADATILKHGLLVKFIAKIWQGVYLALNSLRSSSRKPHTECTLVSLPAEE